ncbi:MAG: hypothetical protein SGJ27_13540 [Candidatus Melainabacteria bacterium]|nr:hypothetical protein [Candidatus Melainabacteria bacterium]
MTELGATALADTAEAATSFIDLEKYAIDRRDTPQYKQLIEHCREQMIRQGACVLKGFVKEEIVQEMVVEATKMAPTAFHNTVTGNAYLIEIDESWPQDDPRRMTDTTSLGAIAYDQMPETSLVRRLYEWDGLMDFLADALGKEKIFRYADPMGALNVAVMKDGDYLRWHFDQTDFVTTILLQSSQKGGAYEFVPMIRSGENPNYDHVKRVLKGSNEGVVTLEIEPGSLVLFEGRNSLHRVTRIEGEQLRLIALLGYDTKPGTLSSDYLRKMRYGRSEPVTSN